MNYDQTSGISLCFTDLKWEPRQDVKFNMAELHGLTCATILLILFYVKESLFQVQNYFTSFSMISSSFNVIVVAVSHANSLWKFLRDLLQWWIQTDITNEKNEITFSFVVWYYKESTFYTGSFKS